MGERFGVFADASHIYMPNVINSEIVLQKLDIDSESFEFLSLYYAKDKNAIHHFYNATYTKTDISQDGFTLLSDSLIKDARGIWHYGNRIDNIPLNISSTELIIERPFLPEFLLKDDEKVYFYNAQIA